MRLPHVRDAVQHGFTIQKCVCVVPIAGTQALARGRSADPSLLTGGLANRSDITPPIREETRPPSATITALLPAEGEGKKNDLKIKQMKR